MTQAEPPAYRMRVGGGTPPTRPLHLSTRPRPVDTASGAGRAGNSRKPFEVPQSAFAHSRHARAGRRRDRDGVGSFLRELPLLVLVAFVLAFALRTFVVQVFYIPSSSMEPTLMVNDRILVDKITYRFRDLQRGEIVVFEGDEFTTLDQDRGPLETVLHGVGQLIGLAPANARDYVKRVIGMPGDHILIDEDGTVYVNDVPLDEPYVAAEDPRPYGPVTVPEGRLFFLGDNRPNSSDSRFENLGFVQRDHVVGRAFLAIWPLERAYFLRTPEYSSSDAALDPAAAAPAAADDLPRRRPAPAPR